MPASIKDYFAAFVPKHELVDPIDPTPQEASLAIKSYMTIWNRFNNVCDALKQVGKLSVRERFALIQEQRQLTLDLASNRNLLSRMGLEDQALAIRLGN